MLVCMKHQTKINPISNGLYTSDVRGIFRYILNIIHISIFLSYNKKKNVWKTILENLKILSCYIIKL